MFRSRLARLLAMFAAAFLIASTAAVVTAAPASAACSVPGTILSTTTGLCYNVPPGSYQPSGAGDNTYGLTCPLPGTTAALAGRLFPVQRLSVPGLLRHHGALRRRRPVRPVLSRGPQPLPPGTYQPVSGATACFAAPPGTYIAFSGATSSSQASLCPPGTWSGSGASSCTDAPPGYRSASSFGSSRRGMLPGHHVTGWPVVLRLRATRIPGTILRNGQPRCVCCRHIQPVLRRHGLPPCGCGPLRPDGCRHDAIALSCRDEPALPGSTSCMGVPKQDQASPSLHRVTRSSAPASPSTRARPPA